MRASPAFQASLRDFGVWRAGVTTLFLVAALTLVVWLALRRPAFEMIASGAVVLALGLQMLAARALLQTPPITMRWDGRRWFVSRDGADPRPGALMPVLDLGPWMLLRFDPETADAKKPATVWIPAQRRGIEPLWHALRCAVYSPHAAPADEHPLEP